MTDDECTCARCQHPVLDSNFGFRDAAQAEALTRQMARGQGKPYWLVRSHTGIWYFVAAPDHTVPMAAGIKPMVRGLRIKDANCLLQYLGCEIVKTFDARGDEVPK